MAHNLSDPPFNPPPVTAHHQLLIQPIEQTEQENHSCFTPNSCLKLEIPHGRARKWNTYRQSP